MGVGAAMAVESVNVFGTRVAHGGGCVVSGQGGKCARCSTRGAVLGVAHSPLERVVGRGLDGDVFGEEDRARRSLVVGPLGLARERTVSAIRTAAWQSGATAYTF